MKDRIRKLRKTLELTQREFAEKIGMKANTIATYEMGRAVPSDPTINNICKEFHVNEQWLRTGEGEMFAPAPASELEALFSRYPNLTHETYALIEKLVSLPEATQKIIMGFLREVVKGFGDVEPNDLAKTETSNATPDELHAELDRQIELEKEAAGKSEAL